jgi:GPI-anchor transamidase subunit S
LQVKKLPNLAIPEFLGLEVVAAMRHAEAAMRALEVNDYESSLSEARKARISAEVAVSHHSIVSQHSYPHQHRLAVYLPLFAPVSLPLGITIIQEWKRRFVASFKRSPVI